MKQLVLSLALLFPLLGIAGPVNINTTDAKAIAEELAGIGMTKAQAIVAYRNEFGSLDTADELIKVKGIGAHVLEENRRNIKVSD